MAVAGYARMLAHVRVQQQQTKPFLGKPYLKYGQCFALAGYFFQLGAILAAKHRGSLDAFGSAFLGLNGDEGAVERYFTQVSDEEVDRVTEGGTFADYVLNEQIERFNFRGDPHDFFQNHALIRVKPEVAIEMVWQFAEKGAILGATQPNLTKLMFESQHRQRDANLWERARASGLEIPPVQSRVSYEDTEAGEEEAFMAYCQECCPNLYHALISGHGGT